MAEASSWGWRGGMDGVLRDEQQLSYLFFLSLDMSFCRLAGGGGTGSSPWMGTGSFSLLSTAFMGGPLLSFVTLLRTER